MALVKLMTSQAKTENILDVRDLQVTFNTPTAKVHAVNGISFAVKPGESLGILGESGSGKSVCVSALMGLLESPPAAIKGNAMYRNTPLLGASSNASRNIFGDRIAMIYQDAITSLNPGLTIGYQLGEVFKVHRPGMSRQAIKTRVIELMQRVGITSASERVNSYPYEFSGGMNQRIMIALGIALEPDLLIADEPTTALDVTVQAQIMTLLDDLRKQTGMAMIFITHDIGLVAEYTDRLMVMYAGKQVEIGPTSEIINHPAHPYTVGLMNSIPQANMKGQRLIAINGSPPKLNQLPTACVFASRCSMAQPSCSTEMPEAKHLTTDHISSCHYAEQVEHG